jgi:hypothetical protein
MNSLFLAVGGLGFLYKSANPLPVICPGAPPLFFIGAAFPFPSLLQQPNVEER